MKKQKSIWEIEISVDSLTNMGNVLKRKQRKSGTGSAVSGGKPEDEKNPSNQDSATGFIDASTLYKHSVAFFEPGTELCVKKPRFSSSRFQGFNTIGGRGLGGLLSGKINLISHRSVLDKNI